MSTGSGTFICRSSVTPSEGTSHATRRLTINPDILKAAKLCAGDIIALHDANNAKNAFAVGIAWPSSEVPRDSIMVSKSVLLTALLEDGGKGRISPVSRTSVQEAASIRLEEISENGGKSSNMSRQSRETATEETWLKLLLREYLVDLKYITATQMVEIIFEGCCRRFAVVQITEHKTTSKGGPSTLIDNFSTLSFDNRKVWTVGWEASIVILPKTAEQPTASHKPEIEKLEPQSHRKAYQSVGGLDKQVAQIRDLLEIPLTRPDLYRYFGLKPPRGILLYGPPGTGKTHLARAIALSTKSSVLVVNGPELSSAYHGETEAKLREVFQEARERRPCIVVLDEVDALVPRREDGAGGEVDKRVVATLLTILDGMNMGGSHDDEDGVVVIGTTNRPNAIDPALRRPGRFDKEIEIGIPDAEARCSILRVLLSNTPHAISEEDLRGIAARAYGYVGADLSAVVREAGIIAIKRCIQSGAVQLDRTSDSQPLLNAIDLVTALPLVRPSGMRSVFLDTPPVRYIDIGGQNEVIEKLREAVEWPLLHPEAFERLGVRPPKGLLLYGPPGCSKTVLVRACATESGVNFIAIKGPELLNKYVGESERAVRETFRRARETAPSIVFFDEIDALATSRSSDSGASGSHEGVLTSLLNEMDGVQELVGVTVVAATNRPDIIDSALMRPGRLDRILYVGPPDRSGREDVLRIHMRKMAVEPDVDVVELAELTEGCSGAEIAALCQEAALLTMKADRNAPAVPHSAFRDAARSMKRQITPEMIRRFERWRDGKSGFL